MKRRDFLQRSSMAAAGISLASSIPSFSTPMSEELFKISLAEWSVNSLVFGDKIQKLGWVKFGDMLKNDYDNLMSDTPMSNLEFPKFARWMGINAVEYVNTCFFNKAENKEYLSELKNTCEGEGVKSLLIMCDAEGALGDKDGSKRKQAVENHYKWVDAAASFIFSSR